MTPQIGLPCRMRPTLTVNSGSPRTKLLVPSPADLVRDAVLESIFKHSHRPPSLFRPDGPDLPEGPQAAACRDEPFITIARTCSKPRSV